MRTYHLCVFNVIVDSHSFFLLLLSMEIVLKEQQGKTVFLTLNRPEKRNALSVEMIDTLEQYLIELNEDEGVRVIVLRANGEAFCAGADLAYLQHRWKGPRWPGAAD